MPILNTKTKEIMTPEIYEKRRALEELLGMHSQALYGWRTEEIEREWFRLIQWTEDETLDDFN